jgi:hypothetical protein
MSPTVGNTSERHEAEILFFSSVAIALLRVQQLLFGLADLLARASRALVLIING